MLERIESSKPEDALVIPANEALNSNTNASPAPDAQPYISNETVQVTGFEELSTDQPLGQTDYDNSSNDVNAVVITDSLGTYLREIGQTPLLSATEEHNLFIDLITACKSNDWVAAQYSRDKLINANLRLVVGKAMQYSTYRLDRQDLIESGNEGLLKAVDTFNPELGYKFSTYATFLIGRSISEALQSIGQTIPWPQYVNASIRLLRHAAENLGESATLDALSKATGMPPERITELQLILHEQRDLISLDATMPGDEQTSNSTRIMGDTIPDTSVEQQHENVLIKMTIASIMEDAHLNPQQRDVIDLWMHSERGNLSEIGKILGLTRERVRIIYIGALATLQETARRRGLFRE